MFQKFNPALQALNLRLQASKLSLDLQGILNVVRLVQKVQQGLLRGPKAAEAGIAVHVFVGNVLAGGRLPVHPYAQCPDAPDCLIQSLGGHPYGHIAPMYGVAVAGHRPAPQFYGHVTNPVY